MILDDLGRMGWSSGHLRPQSCTILLRRQRKDTQLKELKDQPVAVPKPVHLFRVSKSIAARREYSAVSDNW